MTIKNIRTFTRESDRQIGEPRIPVFPILDADPPEPQEGQTWLRRGSPPGLWTVIDGAKVQLNAPAAGSGRVVFPSTLTSDPAVVGDAVADHAFADYSTIVVTHPNGWWRFFPSLVMSAPTVLAGLRVPVISFTPGALSTPFLFTFNGEVYFRRSTIQGGQLFKLNMTQQ